MSRYPNWTQKETEILREKWGKLKRGIPALAKMLGRSERAVRIRANRLKLGPWRDAGEYVTLNALLNSVMPQPNGSSMASTHKYEQWKAWGLPIVMRQCGNTVWYTVRITDFWKWAKKNRDRLDFARFEEDALGKEPQWVKEKRRRDCLNHMGLHPKKLPWSPQEDALLRYKCEQGTTYAELEAALCRSVHSIRRRIYDLYLPHPKRAYAKKYSWTEEDMRRAWAMHREGYSLKVIGDQLGRTANSVRSKIEWIGKKKVKEDGTWKCPSGSGNRETTC